MRAIIVILLLSGSYIANAQVEVKTTKVPIVIWEAKMLMQDVTAHINESDTIYIYTFRDAQYTQITEYESIAFGNRAELIQFLDLAKKVAMDKVGVETKNYVLSFYNKTNTRVTIPGTSKYALIYKKHITKIEAGLAEF